MNKNDGFAHKCTVKCTPDCTARLQKTRDTSALCNSVSNCDFRGYCWYTENNSGSYGFLYIDRVHDQFWQLYYWDKMYSAGTVMLTQGGKWPPCAQMAHQILFLQWWPAHYLFFFYCSIWLNILFAQSSSSWPIVQHSMDVTPAFLSYSGTGFDPAH